MSTLTFTIPGTPRGKGRPKFARMGQHVRAYTDAKTASYENLVALAASEAMREQGIPRFDGPVEVKIGFVLPRPKSAPKRVLHPATRPDLDNLVKAVLDGCNQAGVWSDDARVVGIVAEKRYGLPCCDVTIHELAPPPRMPETAMGREAAR